MNQNIFSWQQGDYLKLHEAFSNGSKILLIHGRDFESPYHIISSFCTQLSSEKYMLLGLCSDSGNLGFPYFPFTQAITKTPTEKPIKKSLLSSIVKDVTQLDTVAAIVEHIMFKQNSSSMLSARENELLLRLEHSANNKAPVFLIYGFSNFDCNSLELTSLLLSGKLNEAFPFLKNSRFLFLCETSEESSFVLQRIKLCEHIDIHLSLPQLNNISEILSKICPGSDFIPADQEKIFCLSGGRLSVIEILSHHLQLKGQSIINQSTQDLISNTLSKRISKMGELGAKLENILVFAANIGNTFNIPLLKKATDPVSCDLALKSGEDEYLTKCNNKTGRFICHEVWSYFSSCASEDKKQEIARILERAVYYFDPYDYLTRARYFEQAGLRNDALDLYILAYNSIFLEGITPDNNLLTRIAALSKQCGEGEYWNDLSRAYSSINQLDYLTCAIILENMALPSSERLLLLKEYLTGLCFHKLGLRSEHQQEAMITMEMAAAHAYDIEEGIWCDCQNALISFWMNAHGNITAAKQACKELTYYYTQKSFSAFAQKGLHALERKWGAIFSAERAVIRTKKSVEYFRNSYYPSQYLMSLNNHAANLILIGHYDEAMYYLNEAFSALKNYPSVSINRMYLLNNYILCAVLSKKLKPDVAYQKLLSIIEEKEFSDWIIILKLNCAIYMALSGNTSDAENNLRELECTIQAIDDDYYSFYVYSNLAAVLYLRGNRVEAVQMLKSQCLKAPTLFKATEKTQAEARTKQWITVMEQEIIEDPKIFDSFLLDGNCVQSQWHFWKRGFLYSDIQFWSES